MTTPDPTATPKPEGSELRLAIAKSICCGNGVCAATMGDSEFTTCQISTFFRDADAVLANPKMTREREDDLTWFWQIVDRDGLNNVPSDERGALAWLVKQAARADAAERQLAEANADAERWKSAWARNEERVIRSCICQFADDGETPIKECALHRRLAAELAEALAAPGQRVKEGDYRSGFEAAIGKAKEVADDCQRPSAIRLAAGEMSAQEMRTAKAVLGWMARRIAALSPASLAETGGREPIPKYIYYSVETDNFYGGPDSAAPGRGQGWDFYNKWHDRKTEFPLPPAPSSSDGEPQS